jgi:hypothetical protein
MIRTIVKATEPAMAIALMFVPVSRAETYACPCVADTYVQLAEGIPWSVDRAGRACEGLYPGSNRNVITDGDKLHNPAGDLRDALFKFDLTGISGAVSSATLRLACTLEKSTGSVATVTVHPVYVDWSESGADWTMRTSTQSWNNGAIEGNGNYDPVPAATRVNTSEENWTGTHVEFDVTALVNRWINGGLTNHGLLLMSASGSGRGKRMDWCSRDGNPWRSNNWPQLIVYTVPPSGTNLQPSAPVRFGHH